MFAFPVLELPFSHGILLSEIAHMCVLCLVIQLCPTLCDPMDCSPPGFSLHGDSPGKNTRLGCHDLLQGIFPTQVSYIAGRFFTVWANREAQESWSG